MNIAKSYMYKNLLSVSQKTEYNFRVSYDQTTESCVNSNISFRLEWPPTTADVFLAINEHSPMKRYLFEMYFNSFGRVARYDVSFLMING